MMQFWPFAAFPVRFQPSVSPSPVGECDRCAYLVGEQCSGLSGIPCMDCAFSNRFSAVSMGCEITVLRVGRHCRQGHVVCGEFC